MKKSNRKIKFRKILKKAIPLWMVAVLIFNSSMAVGFIEFYIMKKNFNNAVLKLSKTTKDPNELVQILKQEALPQKGFTLGVTWGDIGVKLLESGIIDRAKFEEVFKEEPQSKEQMKYLEKGSLDKMTINEKNSHFMVNALWALGLVNKSSVLDSGPMKTYGKGDPMGYASTGGWNLGAKPTAELYSSQALIQLTPEQEALVKKIAENIYRPCCGNSVAFPDCNHGMAALGYIELAVKQGLSEDKIYKDVLALNSFWFPQNYFEMAMMMKKQGTEWTKVDPKLALSSQYSSSQGAARVRQAVQDVPGINVQGGGCGA